MIFKHDLTSEKVSQLYEDPDLVLRFLADVKWEEGYVCRKCGNTNYCPGKAPSSRRCTRCKTDESPTANTLFHNCKFPINKAFQIAYVLCIEGSKISSYQLAKDLQLNQMTCWKFRQRINSCITTHGPIHERKSVPLRRILLSINDD